MKKLNLKTFFLVIIIVLTLGVTLMAGCVSITSPDTTTPTNTITSTSTSWTPPATSGTATQLPNIADVVALVKPSVVAINTEVTSYDFFNRPYTQQGAGSGW